MEELTPVIERWGIERARELITEAIHTALTIGIGPAIAALRNARQVHHLTHSQR